MIFDLIIIGGGPAGITAAIYASRNNLNTLIFSENIGGMLFNKAVNVENYTGFPSINGFELANNFKKHLEVQEHVEIVEEQVEEIKKENNLFHLKTYNKEYSSRTVIVASGSKPRELNLKGEKEFLGRGVGYCPVCDGPLFKNKDVAIVGGGNAAFESAIFLSNIAKNIYIFERGEHFLADGKNQGRIMAMPNVKTYTKTDVLEIKGDKFVKSISFKQEDKIMEIELSAVFIQAGYTPKTEYLKDLVDLNERKEIIVDENMATKTEGLFAAGDITNSKVKQIIVAASLGAIAALSVYNYLLNYEQN
ncbi:MAG: FAD-dependent oxidoreductase [Candidatus Pacebacteria bacterium]|nr:FAD-dependent oxidoreductase [Candidatus Paceibacterota bacterium]